LFGPLGAIILAATITGLPFMIPGYDPIRQTVSEIGEVGSPAQAAFTALLFLVAACILVFAGALRCQLREAGCSTVPAYLVVFTSLSAAGVGSFAYPHPLHNVFGLSEIVGYQAPLALAFAWRRAPRAGALIAFSWVMAVLIWLAIMANVSVLDPHGDFWKLERPVYGLVQRALFAAWIIWCCGAGLLLHARARRGH
jgi:hypothetical membrane protein